MDQRHGNPLIIPHQHALELYSTFWSTGSQRVSNIQRQTAKKEDNFGLGEAATVVAVQQAVYSARFWWVQSNVSQDHSEGQKSLVANLAIHFGQTLCTPVDGTLDPAVLITPAYLTRFMASSTGGKHPELYSSYYWKAFKKCVLTQQDYMKGLFERPSLGVVNHALHGYIWGQTYQRPCPFAGRPNGCYYCARRKFDSIFDFSLPLAK